MNKNSVAQVRVPRLDAHPQSAAHGVTLQLSSNPSAASSPNSRIGTDSSIPSFFKLVTPVLSNIKLQLAGSQTFAAKCSATPLLSNMRGEGVGTKFVIFPVPKRECRLMSSLLFLSTLALHHSGLARCPDGVLRLHRNTAGGPVEHRYGLDRYGLGGVCGWAEGGVDGALCDEPCCCCAFCCRNCVSFCFCSGVRIASILE